MRAPMKEMISSNIAGVIKSWDIDSTTINAISNPTLIVVEPDQEALIKKTKDSFKTLMRISIEFFMEVQEPDFLLREIFQLFVEEGAGNLLAEELKPYILSGQFVDTPFPEDIISQHILNHY